MLRLEIDPDAVLRRLVFAARRADHGCCTRRAGIAVTPIRPRSRVKHFRIRRMKLDPITRANRPKRREVLTGEDEAAGLIKNGDVIIVGGFGTVNHPMPIIRALIRRKVKDLTVIGAATAGLEIDLLIGAGAVRKVIAPYVGAELYAPIGHCFRRAAESGEVEVYETTRISALLAARRRRTRPRISAMAWRRRHFHSGAQSGLCAIQRSDPRRALPRCPRAARRLGHHSRRASGCLWQWAARWRPIWRSTSVAGRRTRDVDGRTCPSEQRNSQNSLGDLGGLRGRRRRGSLRLASVRSPRVLRGGRRSHPGIVSASVAFRRREMRAWDAYLDRWVTGVRQAMPIISRGSARIGSRNWRAPCVLQIREFEVISRRRRA